MILKLSRGSAIAAMLFHFIGGTLPAMAGAPSKASAEGSGEFDGKIGKTYAESRPAFPVDPAPRSGSPNILVWVIDDLGYGQIGSFGGSIRTPNIDRIAAQGLRYSNYHTSPVCAASRAALMTGRNPHAVHVGNHSVLATGFPGYDARIPPGSFTFAKHLQAAGYLTYALGKWDHLPTEHTSSAGPFRYWPSGQGFDRFYGFLSGDAPHFEPTLWSDHSPVAHKGADDSYFLTTDLADRAIDWIESRNATEAKRPFLMYFATGAVHSPHHAPASFLKAYEGHFDEGWDKLRQTTLDRQKQLGLMRQNVTLPDRPDGMPAWTGLSSAQKSLYAKQMEAFAAQLTHADAEFGRIIETLRDSGELDNTVIIITADNGASAEGGPEGTFNETSIMNGLRSSFAENAIHISNWGTRLTNPHYSFGWAVAGNTPFRYYKQTTFEGSLRVPLIIAWPSGIPARGEIRDQYHYVTDIFPTILEASGIVTQSALDGRSQDPIDGVSMMYSFGEPHAPTTRRVQYYEMFSNRGIWQDGWMAVAPYRLKVWDAAPGLPLDSIRWELYDLAADPTQQNDLSAKLPRKLEELKSLFDREAHRNNVYPLMTLQDIRREQIARVGSELLRRKGLWNYPRPVTQVPAETGPPVLARSFRMTVDVSRLRDNANGVVFARGGRYGGLSLYFQEGRPILTYIGIDMIPTTIAAERRIDEREGKLRLDLLHETDDGAQVRIFWNSEPIAHGEIEGEIPAVPLTNDAFDIGRDTGSSPTASYAVPSIFEGQLRNMKFQFDVDENEH